MGWGRNEDERDRGEEVVLLGEGDDRVGGGVIEIGDFRGVGGGDEGGERIVVFGVLGGDDWCGEGGGGGDGWGSI